MPSPGDSAPLAFFELHTASGETVVTPLAYPETAWLGSSASTMARRMARAVQSALIDQGRYLEATQLADPCTFTRQEIDVDLPAGANPLLQPARRCRHIAFVASGDSTGARSLGCVPALGIVALAEPERLPAALADAIVQEHRRNGRLADTRAQVAAGWFEQIELKQLPLDLHFHSAEALRRLQEERSEPLLKAVASEMPVATRAATGLAEVLTQLTRAAEGSFARSVLVLGAEGGGKTALLHEYVRARRQRGLAAPWETSAARLIQGLTGDGGWQHALARLCRELAEHNVLLCVGHLAELFEVGQYQGNAVSLGEALREPLARGRLMLLAEATPVELARIELRSPGFAALFQTVRLPEFAPDAQERIMSGAIAALAAEHKVRVAPEAVGELIALQRRFSPYSGFPGKGIRFFESLILHARSHATNPTPTLGRDVALDAFCAETGMPRRMLDPRLPLDLDEVDRFFRERIFGQPQARAVLTGLLATAKTGLARSGKPIASLLLIGPTGVGKTETAKALAEFMFGDARRMIRLDMSEYADPAAVLRLLGDLGGEGTLIGAVRRQPFSVVLFDELEKAHPSFFDLLLQVLGEGRLTGGDGLTANFCGSFVLMTSNLGAEAMQRAPMAMTAVPATADDLRRNFEQAVQQALRPELFNRIDHLVPFAPLSAADRAPIFAREIGLLRTREGLRERNATLAVADNAAAQLATLPADARYGARDLQRVLRRELLLPLAHALAPHAYVTPLAVQVDATDATLKIRSEGLQRPIDNAPAQAADMLAQARRTWQRVTEGPLFVSLVNQVFRLDKERQRYEKKRRRAPHLPHWDGTEDAARARELTAIQHSAKDLFTDIIDLEGQALLALAGEPEAAPDVAAWRERFAAFKQRAFHAVRPDSGRCTVGLYAAPRLLPMLQAAWCETAALAGFTLAEQKVVRLGEAPRKMPPVADGSANDGTDAAPAPSAYLKFPWPEPVGRANGGPLVGFELEFKGPGVYDYFRGESGLWRLWEGDRKTDAWIAVRPLALAAFQTPDKVHRQHFFDGLPVARQLKQGQLSAPDADWRCDFPDAVMWRRMLDRHFEARTDRMLLGEEE